MDITAIQKKVNEVVVERLGVNESEVIPTAEFRADLDCDSLDAAELFMDIEREFSVAFSEPEMEKIVTVKDAVDLVDSKLNPK